ncbi:stage II sporulation protein D SpoIID [Desulfocucumis palustris]|uniref:Stage II sporulation protein D SpoIID n=1 Tax=Desulfocucumis palustris TaxID=1898651 RepID=A0A2L2XHK0_9FIRM|nr:stage II sporulation protein D [Desulfocucumis palustris]GBF35630.1 stage II sporulation protein D SpoIID [Desulfocucumis palustris]
MFKKTIIISIALLLLLILGIPAAINWFSPARISQSGTQVSLYLHRENRVVNIPLEEYLVGVVAAEMPAAFPMEALKAQAVAARTYVLKRMGPGELSNPVHPGAVACDDPRHFQAWISAQEMKKRWGTLGYYEYYLKISSAVKATGGEVITYQGSLIDPVYHSSCGGAGTENAVDVWRFDIPYLKAVACPYDADPEPERTVFIGAGDVLKALRLEKEAVPVSTGGYKLPEIEIIEKTQTGRPKTLKVNGENISASTFRDYLGLRSTNFKLTEENGGLKVETLGYGHAVGMCQYGAKGMALKGKDYREIIRHYYTGADIIKQ